jgi:hypothetical protein
MICFWEVGVGLGWIRKGGIENTDFILKPSDFMRQTTEGRYFPPF